MQIEGNELTKSLFRVGVVFFLITLVMKPHINAYTIGFLIIIQLVRYLLKYDRLEITLLKICLWGYFSVYFFEATAEGFSNYSLSILTKKLSFLIFPFFNFRLVDSKASLKIFSYYLLGVIVFCYISEAVRTGLFYPQVSSEFYYNSPFTRQWITKPIGNIHAGYLSIYLIFALNYLLKQKEWYKDIFSILFMVLCPIFLLFLGSKYGLVLLAVTLIYHFLLHPLFSMGYNKTLNLIVLVSLSVITTIFALNNNQIRYRIGDELSVSFDFKYQQWSTAFELIKRKPIFGYSLSATRDSIADTSEAMSFENPQRFDDVHNVFLTELIKTGALGFVFLCLFLSLSIYIAFKAKNELLLIFLVTFLFFSLFESTLSSQKGIVYFCFFIMLLIQKK